MMKARARQWNPNSQICALQKKYNPLLLPGKPFISKYLPMGWFDSRFFPGWYICW